MRREELKPCPFCGGDAELDTRQSFTYMKAGRPRQGLRIAVYCRDCSADIGICREDVPEVYPELVIEMWNNRSAALQQQEGSGPVAWMKRTNVSSDWDAYDFSANPSDEFCIPLFACAPSPAEQQEGEARDAARYRWLREANPDEGPFAAESRQNGWGNWFHYYLVGEELDAAIDAALASSREGKP